MSGGWVLDLTQFSDLVNNQKHFKVRLRSVWKQSRSHTFCTWSGFKRIQLCWSLLTVFVVSSATSLLFPNVSMKNFIYMFRSAMNGDPNSEFSYLETPLGLQKTFFFLLTWGVLNAIDIVKHIVTIGDWRTVSLKDLPYTHQLNY